MAVRWGGKQKWWNQAVSLLPWIFVDIRLWWTSFTTPAHIPSFTTIVYNDSTNLDYDGTKIHPSYHRWIRNLNRKIQRALPIHRDFEGEVALRSSRKPRSVPIPDYQIVGVISKLRRRASGNHNVTLETNDGRVTVQFRPGTIDWNLNINGRASGQPDLRIGMNCGANIESAKNGGDKPILAVKLLSCSSPK